MTGRPGDDAETGRLGDRETGRRGETRRTWHRIAPSPSPPVSPSLFLHRDASFFKCSRVKTESLRFWSYFASIVSKSIFFCRARLSIDHTVRVQWPAS